MNESQKKRKREDKRWDELEMEISLLEKEKVTFGTWKDNVDEDITEKEFRRMEQNWETKMDFGETIRKEILTEMRAFKKFKYTKTGKKYGSVEREQFPVGWVKGNMSVDYDSDDEPDRVCQCCKEYGRFSCDNGKVQGVYCVYHGFK